MVPLGEAGHLHCVPCGPVIVNEPFKRDVSLLEHRESGLGPSVVWRKSKCACIDPLVPSDNALKGNSRTPGNDSVDRPDKTLYRGYLAAKLVIRAGWPQPSRAVRRTSVNDGISARILQKRHDVREFSHPSPIFVGDGARGKRVPVFGNQVGARSLRGATINPSVAFTCDGRPRLCTNKRNRLSGARAAPDEVAGRDRRPVTGETGESFKRRVKDTPLTGPGLGVEVDKDFVLALNQEREGG